MRVGRVHPALLGLALAVVLAVACFSEHTPTAPGTAVVCNIPLGPGVAGSTLVAIRNFSFQANDVHVRAGSSVTWVNCEAAGTPSHTSTSDQAAWQSPLLAPGETFTKTFDTPGVFSYHCTPHPFMTGRVMVD